MVSGSPALTVVVPVFNQEREIAETLEAVDRAAARSPFSADVIVVDDGSTDETATAARGAAMSLPVAVLSQENAGRLAARRAGLAAAGGDYVLFIDSRVTIDEDALRFVAEAVTDEPPRSIWNGHVDIETDGNPYGVFWDVVAQTAFAAYFSDPRTTSFGPEEFDAFPKGAGCFFAPRDLLVEALDGQRSGYADERYANDDTVMIRRLAAAERINISPGFRCTYQPRQGLERFARHAFHRGIVFLDGHGHRGTRLFPLVAAFYPLSVAWVVLAARSRTAAVFPVAAAAAGGAAVALRLRRPQDAPVLAALAPVYAVAHGAGMWRGALMMLRDRRRR
jgi:glycosyltransferase involved in cell wall biosynthesis